MSTRAERRLLQEQQRAAKALAQMTARACEIVLVRHGETAWNAEERLQGQLQPGPGLTERGRRQAEALGRRLQAEQFAAIYSSDLLRATETADAIVAARRRWRAAQAAAAVSGCSNGALAAAPAAAAAPAGQGSEAAEAAEEEVEAVQVEAALRERYLGVLQGLTRREAAQQHPAEFASLSLPAHAPEEGFPETLQRLEARVEAALAALAARHAGQRLLVVSHGGFLSVAHCIAAGFHSRERNVNASINTIRVDAPAGGGAGGARWAVVRWGDDEHLSGVGALASAFGGGTAG